MNGHGCRVPSPASDDVLYKGNMLEQDVNNNQLIIVSINSFSMFCYFGLIIIYIHVIVDQTWLSKQTQDLFKFIYCNHVRPFQVFSMFSVHPQSQITYLCFRKKTYTNLLSFFILLVYPNLGSNGKTKQI